MARLPILSSKDFTWKGSEGSTTADRLRANITTKGFYIRSARTGEQRLFLYDNQTMADNEFFDGEAHAFFSPAGGVKVRIWVSEG